MGKAKEGRRPLWLLEVSVWVSSFFPSPSPIPHKNNAVFFVFFFLDLIQHPSSGPRLASRGRCGKGCLDLRGSNIGVGAAA